MTLDIFPWQIKQWQQLLAMRMDERLPHAILLAGVEGLGKKHFSEILTKKLLCQGQQPHNCDCRSCHLIHAQSHPDLLIVEPLQKTQLIKIDQIREAMQFVYETSLLSGLRIVIINPAEALNTFAHNALLKTLEEPAPNTLIILISNQYLRLPATIRSRCHTIIFQKPESQVALTWLQNNTDKANFDLSLKLADGAPLSAKTYLEEGMLAFREEFYQDLIQTKNDPLHLAAKYQDQDILSLLTLLITWLEDLLRLQVAKVGVKNIDYKNHYEKLILKLSYKELIEYLDHVKKIYIYFTNSNNLNRQLVLEELFIRWKTYAAC